MAKVSILVTVFNEARFVEKMILGIANQTYKDIELIIVNDGSTDATAEIIRNLQLRYSWIKLFNLSKNRGKCFAQNLAFESCSGKYIAFHGGDDVSHPERIFKQIHFLVMNNIQACITEMRTIDSYDQEICAIFGTGFVPTKSPNVLLRGRSFPAGTLMISRDLANKVYPIPHQLPYEDRWIAFKVQFSCAAIGFISQSLYDYRIHGKNSYLIKSTNSIFRKIKAFKKMYVREKRVDFEIYWFLKKKGVSNLDDQFYQQVMLIDRCLGALPVKEVIRNFSIIHGARGKLLLVLPNLYFLLLAIEHTVATMRNGACGHPMVGDRVIPICCENSNGQC